MRGRLKLTGVSLVLLGIAGCFAEGWQGFDLVRADGTKALCGTVVPASMIISKRIDPMTVRCVVACENLGFRVESSTPPGLTVAKIGVAGDTSATECLILKKKT
jgi:hypothetical protein